MNVKALSTENLPLSYTCSMQPGHSIRPQHMGITGWPDMVLLLVDMIRITCLRASAAHLLYMCQNADCHVAALQVSG